MYLEIDEVKCENIDRIEFDDVAMEIVLTDEKVYERIKRWPRQIIENIGERFGLTASDNPFLDEYYLNNVPLEN